VTPDQSHAARVMAVYGDAFNAALRRAAQLGLDVGVTLYRAPDQSVWQVEWRITDSAAAVDVRAV
jgi:hypothetical protein